MMLGSPRLVPFLQVLPVEALNAITFGCAWAAGTVQCSRSAPPGLEATTQSIYAVGLLSLAVAMMRYHPDVMAR